LARLPAFRLQSRAKSDSLSGAANAERFVLDE
jgi:hypothetical protein